MQNKTTLILGPRACGKTWLIEKKLVSEFENILVNDPPYNNIDLYNFFNPVFDNRTRIIVRDYFELDMYKYINRIDNLIIFRDNLNNDVNLKTIYYIFLRFRSDYTYEEFKEEIINLKQYEYKFYSLENI